MATQLQLQRSRSLTGSMRGSLDNAYMPPAGSCKPHGSSLSMDAHKAPSRSILGDSFSTACSSPTYGAGLRTPSTSSSLASSPAASPSRGAQGHYARCFPGGSSGGESPMQSADMLQSLPSRSRRRDTPHTVNGLPRVTGSMRQRNAPIGYGGHIAGKVAENMHGGTNSEENRRATGGLAARDDKFHSRSAPDLYRSTVSALSDSAESAREKPGPGYRVVPRLPGTACHIAGKMSESVRASTFAESNMKAQALRHYNPHVNADGWLRKGEWPVNRTDTYQWAPGQSAAMGMLPHFTLAEQAAANEGCRRMGSTFGMKLPEKNDYMPGSRYLLAGHKPGKMPHFDSSRMAPAGMPTHCEIFDDARWKYHIKWTRQVERI